MGQKEVKNENCCGVFEMRDLARFFSEVLKLLFEFYFASIITQPYAGASWYFNW